METKRFNLLNRLIHWAIAFTILFLLLTVFLRMGWMNKTQIGDIVQQNLHTAGTDITTDTATVIGKAVRRPMWNYHIWAGYLMIALYIFRMLLTAFNGKTFKGPFSKDISAKLRLKAWIYVIFYVLLSITLLTGFMIENGPLEWKKPLEAVHAQSLYYVVGFIILHIGGVMIADSTDEKGIISRMVSGDSPQDKTYSG